MTCPFLKETQVKYCQMAGVRKMIPLAGSLAADALPAAEKCTSEAFTLCPVYQRRAMDTAAAGRCPWLQESLMQYCAVAPVQKFVPYTESVLSRCGNESFRYCEAYLSLAHPEREEDEVDGVRMPTHLLYTNNHLWLDVSADGACHAGIDDFLGRLLSTVERIRYVWMKGQHRPAAVLTVRGVDLQVVFPNPLMLAGCNLYLRADPGRCTAEPYTAGWLWEGTALPETTRGLMQGAAARQWMRGEHGRMNSLIHEYFAPAGCGQLSGDGGVFSPDLIQLLEPEQIEAMFYEFFSPFANEKKEP